MLFCCIGIKCKNVHTVGIGPVYPFPGNGDCVFSSVILCAWEIPQFISGELSHPLRSGIVEDPVVPFKCDYGIIGRSQIRPDPIHWNEYDVSPGLYLYSPGKKISYRWRISRKTLNNCQMDLRRLDIRKTEYCKWSSFCAERVPAINQSDSSSFTARECQHRANWYPCWWLGILEYLSNDGVGTARLLSPESGSVEWVRNEQKTKEEILSHGHSMVYNP